MIGFGREGKLKLSTLVIRLTNDRKVPRRAPEAEKPFVYRESWIRTISCVIMPDNFDK
jgi:hypothetical protein